MSKLLYYRPQYIIPLIFVSTSPFLIATQALADKPFIMNSGANNPLFSTNNSGFYNHLSDEIFKRMGIEVRNIKLPSQRALLNLNSGIDDGNIARIKGLEKKFPNLVRVPEKIIDFEFMAYAHTPGITISNWKSLKPYTVGIMTGWKIYEKNVTQYKKLTKVKNPKLLFTLLGNKRSDIVLFDRWMGLWWAKKLGIQFELIEPPIAKRSMFIYLHKKHKTLVSQISKTIRTIKADGTYKKFFDKTLSVLKK